MYNKKALLKTNKKTKNDFIKIDKIDKIMVKTFKQTSTNSWLQQTCANCIKERRFFCRFTQ